MILGQNKTFIIAEAANNHMCSIENAKLMIEEVRAAGCDAIKFQTYKSHKLVRKDAKSYWLGKEISQLEYYSRLDKFGYEEYRELFDYAKRQGVIAFSTPFDKESADMLEELGVELFKIASCEIRNKSLIEHVARFKKPMIISTGGSTLSEISEALYWCNKNENYDVALLACMLSYPTSFDQANVRRVQELIQFFPLNVIGISDHTPPDPNMVIPSVAVALGAQIVEKHYTLDRSWEGSGHSFSSEFFDLCKMVENIRLTEKCLGNPSLEVNQIEESAVNSARKSIVASRDIKTGEILSVDMLTFKRPADGLSPDMIGHLIGKQTTVDINSDEIINPYILKIVI